MVMDTEKALFQAFTLPARKWHYIELLDTRRGREKLRGSLDHFHDLDPLFCWKVRPSQQNRAYILRFLESFGAPPVCHLVSSNSNLDGREMLLADALAHVVGSGYGTFISCIPGELAYFEGEEPNERYICRRELDAK